MNLTTIHAEIAKERFLDIMAARNVKPDAAAVVAISQADAFIAAYGRYAPDLSDAKRKGCPACFGSGGKRGSPCFKCHGTGRVMP